MFFLRRRRGIQRGTCFLFFSWCCEAATERRAANVNFCGKPFILDTLNVSRGSRRGLLQRRKLLLSTAVTFTTAGQRAASVRLAATDALNLNDKYLFDPRVICSIALPLQMTAVE